MTDSQLDCDTATAPEMASAVVEYIEEHGWTQGTLLDANSGAVCLVGALGGVCTGDPLQGYGICGGYRVNAAGAVRVADLLVPAGVLALAYALKAEGTISIYTDDREIRNRVSDSRLTSFNDTRNSVDEVLAPFRKIAQGEVKTDD